MSSTKDPAANTPCCICGELKPSSRPLSRRHRTLLKNVPQGTMIGTRNSVPLFLPPSEQIEDESFFLCFCQPCRTSALEHGARQTPTQKHKSTRKRKNNETLISSYPRKKNGGAKNSLEKPNTSVAQHTYSTFEANEISDAETSQTILESHLLALCESLEAQPGRLVWLLESFSAYTKICSDINIQNVSLKTFSRRIAAIPKLSTTKTCIPGKGSIITLQQTATKMALDAITGSNSNNEKRRAALKQIASRYSKKDGRLLSPESREQFVLDCLSAIDSHLFREEMMDVEPPVHRKRRAVIENALGNLIEEIPLPYGTALPSGINTLHRLKKADFRRVVRVLFIMQVKAFTLDSRCCGPLLWAFGNALHLDGNRSLLTLANHVGVSPSYNVLEMNKQDIFRRKLQKPESDKVNKNAFMHFAWDNLDVCKTFNAVRRIGVAQDWHGTVLMSQQSNDIPPVFGEQSFSPLSFTRFPTPTHMLEDERVWKKSHLRDAQSLFLGLIYFFRDNLLSPHEDCRVSLDFLLKNALQFKSIGKRTAFYCENLTLLSLPSNSVPTTEVIFENVLEILISHSEQSLMGHSMAIPACALTADNPLYLRMIEVIYNCFGPERRPEFSNIIPQMGLMHCSMALFDAAKYVCFDAFMDGLMNYSGFSPGAQAGFRKQKDFKSNLRFFLQATCAAVLRIIDELIEEGLCFSDGSPLQHVNISAKPPTLEQKLQELLALQGEESRYNVTLEIPVRDQFFPPCLASIGSRISDALHQKLSSLNSPNESFYSSIVLNVLIPCLAFHFFSRAGHLKERNSMLTSLIPILYCSGKLNYQKAVLFDLREKMTMPFEMHSILYDSIGSCCSTTGNPQSYQHNDEALESSSVLVTKEGAAIATEQCVRKSFYTVTERTEMVSAVKVAVAGPKTSGSDAEESILLLSVDRLSSTSTCTLQMYKRLSGLLPGCNDKFPFFSVAHRAYPILINPVSHDNLELSVEATRKCVNMVKHGKDTFDSHGRTFLHPWRDGKERKAKWTRKHMLGGFASARDNVLRNSKSARQTKERRSRKELVRKTFAQRGMDLVHAVETSQKVLAEKIKRNIDLVTPFPHAFMNTGDENPKHTAKSETLLIFQDLAGFGGNMESSENLLLVDGYPDFREDMVAVAVDGMNFVHSGVQKDFSLTIRMHVEQISERILRAVPPTVRRKSCSRDVHFDYSDAVPIFKNGEQARRDDRRLQGQSDAFNRVMQNLDSAPPSNWKAHVLSNRTEKKALCNTVAASVIILACLECRTHPTCQKSPLRIFGASFSISNTALGSFVQPEDLLLHMFHDGEPAIILKSEKGEIFREDVLKILPTSCITVQSFVDAESAPVSKIKIDSTGENCVGEGEVRMQSQLSMQSENYPVAHTSLGALQISSDTDNILLALLASEFGFFSNFNNVLVKLPTRYADIKQLQKCLRSIDMDFRTFVRLFCICGNDFCCGCSVATPKVLIATYLQFKSLIGDLVTAESTSKLYYLAFLKKRRLLEKMDSHQLPFFSTEWKLEARKNIAYHSDTTCSDHLLPQDEDLVLQHLRVSWNVTEYWEKCGSRRVLPNCENPEEWGFNKNGEMLLFRTESILERKKIINSLRPPHCGCGRTGASDSCCNPEKNPTCTCVKNGISCSFRCKCNQVKCFYRKEMSPSSVVDATVHSMSISEILNGEEERESEKSSGESENRSESEGEVVGSDWECAYNEDLALTDSELSDLEA